MPDDQTVTTVAAQPEPNSPAVAGGLGVGNTILIVLAGTSTIMTVFSTGGLTAVYNWLNSIQGAPFLAIASLGAAAGWRAFTKWRRDKLLNQQHDVIQTIANAPRAEAQATVDTLRAASPPAEPLKS